MRAYVNIESAIAEIYSAKRSHVRYSYDVVQLAYDMDYVYIKLRVSSFNMFVVTEEENQCSLYSTA